MSPSPRAPRGREAVTAAILDAAAALFADRGTEAVSIRDIAERARVNHGLVHRHFGSKAALVRAVMDRLVAKLDGGVEVDASSPGDLFLAAEKSRYWRVLARALLDGADPRDLQGGFPVIERLVGAAREAQKNGLLRDDLDAEHLVAMGVTLGLGWMVFSPFVVAATGMKRRDAKPERLMASWLRLMVARSDG
jgi:AcrR family transcriptional regulator